MAVLKTIAHLNDLTKDVTNDYFVLPLINGTLYEADINSRLEVKQIATKNVDGLAYLNNFFNECILALTEGYNVVTSLFQGRITIRGVVYTQNLGHNIPAEQLNVGIHLLQGPAARLAASQLTVHVVEQPAPVGPVIQSVTNPVTNVTDTLNTGAMVLIQGMRLTVKGQEGAVVGVRFTSLDSAGEVLVPPVQLSPNQPTRLQFVLPAAVTAGQWSVSVGSQATGASGVFTKDVRWNEYPNPIHVI
ncbi:MAG: hypothetical protein EZS26_002651 [Candidatus Ordinivivax streblomastigis]|uniref:Uncharacterized protein n=1 Tax=Candidatus Ordinivivax streblomastigis TaxID=2540710 RepID=A0A5M8NXC0_9BACT|nr:MAG: hypothetical protein EZS26_002651 [Candidatus Ordinivivax streblomastigis]